MASAALPIPDQRFPQPSSLTKAGARTGETCQSCGSERLTSLSMTLTDGTPVAFQSCHKCEYRSWTHRGTNLPLADVLTRATKQK